MKLQSKKMPISVRFRLSPTDTIQRLLQFTLRVDTRDSTRLGVTMPDGQLIYLREREWEQKAQKMRGNSLDAGLINKVIVQLNAALRKIHADQWQVYATEQDKVERGLVGYNPFPRPTWESVLFRHQKSRDPWIEPIEALKGVVTGGRWAYVVPVHERPLALSPQTDIKAAMAAYLIEVQLNGRRDQQGQMVAVSEHVRIRLGRTLELLRGYQTTPVTDSFGIGPLGR